jgi:hypothetical protein
LLIIFCPFVLFSLGHCIVSYFFVFWLPLWKLFFLIITLFRNCQFQTSIYLIDVINKMNCEQNITRKNMPFWFTCSKRHLNYLAFQSFDDEHTQWRLFQKRDVCTKLDIHVFITCVLIRLWAWLQIIVLQTSDEK